MRGRAMVIVFLLLASIPAAPAFAGSTTHFGNSGFPTTMTLNYSSAGYDVTTNITLGASSVISSADLDISGQAFNGTSPETIAIDIGDDGDLEWYWGGDGNGSFGYLNVLSDGSSRVAMNLSTGSNSNNYLRLPLNATVTSSSLQVSTLSTMTLSGSDVRDSYLHQPNPSYGNAANKDKNFGNNTHTVVGKTEWANWNIYRGVYWFDLSVLPGATVLDANLSLFVSDGVKQAGSTQTATTSHYYTIFPLSKQWEEGQEVNAAVTNGPGVTWNNAIDNVTGTDFAWSASGASGGADRLSSVGIVYDSPANLEMNWLNYQNQNLTDLVQSWANGTVINNGLLLTGDENTSKPDGSRLTIIARQNSTHGPRLVITFAGSDDVTAGLDVGADGNFEWNHTGNLSNASSIPDFSNTLNDYLANASASFTDDWGNEFVDIPLNITGNSTLVISDIEVQYDWEAAVTISPNNDLLSEMNQHLSNGTVDATGNVSIPINVTSGSAGSIKLLNLWLGQGDRPPSIGAISLPGNTIVPDGEIDSIDIEVTSYQGLNNLSWVTMYPLLSNVASRPMFFHSFENDTTWINDPSNFVDNMSGYWNPLNSDTGRMSWNFSSNWNWPVLENVIWQTQAWTVDGLSVNRPSSQTTFHENRLHITSFVVYDETAPSDSSTIVEPTEWVAGGDTLRVAGTIRFLDETSYPMVNDVMINLQNISGNGTVDSIGAYSIFTQVPSLNQYDGLTIGANLSINDYTTPGLAHLTFNVDATSPGMLANSPIGTRILPDQNQLFNVTITDGSDSLGLDNGSLMMRYWVEGLHDDGDGVPQYSEYANKPLLRVNQSDYFHAKFDDTFNAHGQLVSIFIEGSDKVGNLLGSGPGVANDSIHYTSLVPQSSTLENFSFTLPGGDTLVPGHLAWINLTLSDINGLEDLEKIELILGQSRGFTWERGGEFVSNYPYLTVESSSLFEVNSSIYLNLSFMASPQFEGVGVEDRDLTFKVTDSSGEQNFDPGVIWHFNPDIMLENFTLNAGNRSLIEGDYIAEGTTLTFTGKVRFVAVDLAPPSYSYSVSLEAPQDLPLALKPGEDGWFSGNMNAIASGLYRVSLGVYAGNGIIEPTPIPIRLQIDDQAPAIIGFEPAMVAMNSTGLILQFELQEIDAGLNSENIPVTCIAKSGLSTIGDEIIGEATLIIGGDISRFVVNLSFETIRGDYLECWFDVGDNAGNPIGGEGSAQTWPIRISIEETRPDFEIISANVFSQPIILGQKNSIKLDISNQGSKYNQQINLSFGANTLVDDRVVFEEIETVIITAQDFENGIVVIEWVPDWIGELELVIIIDSDNVVDESSENNSFTLDVYIDPAPVDDGFFSSQSSLVMTGVVTLLIGCIVMLLVALRRREGGYEEWIDEEDED